MAVKYNVDRRCIRDWVRQDNAGAFGEESPRRFRLGGGGRRVACEELDSLLIAEVCEVRSKHLRVTRRRVVDGGKDPLDDGRAAWPRSLE